NADMHCAQREERVLDAVVREDRDRPFGVEAAFEERLADAPRRAVRLAIRDLAPRLALAFREEVALRRLVRPPREPLGDAARVGRELLRRAKIGIAAPALEIHRGRRKAQCGLHLRSRL